MNEKEILKLPNAELRIKVALLTGATEINQDPDDENVLEAYWPERDEGRGEGWQEILDYPNDIEAAMELVEYLSRMWSFTRLPTANVWEVQLIDQVPVESIEDESLPYAITRAFVLAMTQKEEDDVEA